MPKKKEVNFSDFKQTHNLEEKKNVVIYQKLISLEKRMIDFFLLSKIETLDSILPFDVFVFEKKSFVVQ